MSDVKVVVDASKAIQAAASAAAAKVSENNTIIKAAEAVAAKNDAEAAAAQSAANAVASGAILFSTRADLYADLAHAEKVKAFVGFDTTVDYNGYYDKVGASGAGGWNKSTYVPPIPMVTKDQIDTIQSDTENIGRSVNERSSFGGANYYGSGATGVLTTYDDLERVKVVATHTAVPTYSYVSLRLLKTRAELLANPEKYAIYMHGNFSGTVSVLLSPTESWATNKFIKNIAFNNDDVSKETVIDFTDSSIISFITGLSSTYLYVLVPLFGSGNLEDCRDGTFTLQAEMIRISANSGNRQIIDVARTAYNALLADGIIDSNAALLSPIYTFSSGPTGSTNFRKSISGLTSRITRPEYSNPDLIWNYGMISVKLGTVADIQGKKFYTHWDMTNSGLQFKSQPRLSKAYTSWGSNSIALTAYDNSKYYNVYDAYSAVDAAGWAEADTVYLMFTYEYLAGTGPTTMPAIDVDFSTILISDPAMSDKRKSFMKADLLEGFNQSEYPKLTDVKSLIGGLGNIPYATGISASVGTGATYNFESPNKANMTYQAGSATGSIYYVRYALCKISELAGANVYIKGQNDNTEATDIADSGFKIGFSNTNVHDWGQVKYMVPFTDCLSGKAISGNTIRTALIAAGYLDTDTCYVQLSNSGAYYAQTTYSCNKTFQCIVSNAASVISAKFMGTHTSNSLDAMQTAISEIAAEMAATNYITYWGDSLTAGGGWTTILATGLGLIEKNAGTGGETVRTIAARQGADVMTVNNITIPADTTPVVVASRATDGGIKTAFGYTATPLLQGGSSHVNPCKIGDIEGTLDWTGSSSTDATGTWTFTRTTAGDAVTITRPTALRTDYDMNYNSPYLQIIFMGQNGGYTDIDDLVNMHKLMIAHANAKHTLVLGMHTGTAASRADYEAAMEKAFGRYFISLRQYLAHPIYAEDGTTITSCYGLADAGLTATEADLTAIAIGQCPPQLLSDGTHYITATKTVLGNFVTKTSKELNI